jgi:hypothetical protein
VPGPGFPTIQLFNAGAVEALGSGAVDGPAAAALAAHAPGVAAGSSGSSGGEVVSFFSKAHGAGCAHHAGLAADEAALLRDASSWPRIGGGISNSAVSEPAAAAATQAAIEADAAAPRVVGLAASSSPACVPSLNFSHPSKPGRMALPSVPELVRDCPGWGLRTAQHSQWSRCLPSGTATHNQPAFRSDLQPEVCHR